MKTRQQELESGLHQAQSDNEALQFQLSESEGHLGETEQSLKEQLGRSQDSQSALSEQVDNLRFQLAQTQKAAEQSGVQESVFTEMEEENCGLREQLAQLHSAKKDMEIEGSGIIVQLKRDLATANATLTTLQDELTLTLESATETEEKLQEALRQREEANSQLEARAKHLEQEFHLAQHAIQRREEESLEIASLKQHISELEGLYAEARSRAEERGLEGGSDRKTFQSELDGVLHTLEEANFQLTQTRELAAENERRLEEAMTLLMEKEDIFAAQKFQLEGTISTLKLKVHDLTDETNDVRLALAERDKEITGVQNQLLEATQGNTNQNNSAPKQAFSSLFSIVGVEEISRALKMSEEQAELVEGDMLELRSKIDTLTSETETLQLELAHAQQSNGSIEGDYQQKFAKFQQQIRDQAVQVEHSLATCEDLNKELEETKQVINMLEGSLREQQKIHRAEDQGHKALQTKFAELEADKDSLLSQLEALHTEMSGRLTEMKDLKKHVSESEAKVSTLQEKNRQLEKSLGADKDRQAQAEHELEKRDTLISSLKQSLQKATQNFDQLEADFNTASKKLKTADTKLQDVLSGLLFSSLLFC